MTAEAAVVAALSAAAAEEDGEDSFSFSLAAFLDKFDFNESGGLHAPAQRSGEVLENEERDGDTCRSERYGGVEDTRASNFLFHLFNFKTISSRDRCPF
jgi:hypothetical protein